MKKLRWQKLIEGGSLTYDSPSLDEGDGVCRFAEKQEGIQSKKIDILLLH
jgi:hypothetical protein